MMKNWRFISLSLLLVIGCNQKDTNVPVVGFVDAFEDNTIGQAKTGFIDALEQAGYEEKKGTLKIIYRNAQGNIPTLTQIINYFIAQEVTLIATNPSLSTITAVQNNLELLVRLYETPRNFVEYWGE